MTYTFGETTHHAETIAHRIALAEQKHADLQAALKLQQLEEQNARAQAAIHASETRTAQALARQQEIHHTYPTHPNWRRNQIEANREMKEWGAKKKALACSSRVTVAAQGGLQGVAGVVAPLELSRPLQSVTGLAA